MVPPVHKFDRMGGADATASLAEGAICRARGEVRFDGVERTDFHALVAGDTGGLDFSFGRTEEVAQGENGAARTNILDHQGDFGAQRSGFALNALERSREDSGQASQGSCPCREQNETTAVHCVWERLSMPERVSNDLSCSSLGRVR